jgi:GNAT superfamily N-acetyltransferase
VYSIRPALPTDLPDLSAIELAAARLLEGHAPESVLLEITSPDDFEEAQRDGLLWAALDDDRPVGFAQVKLLEPLVAHLDEIDVHPNHGRRGLGTRLVQAVCTWALDAGYHAVTLTTFRDVVFNMPFYGRLGFAPIEERDLTPALLVVIADETRRGLDPTRRVAMRRVLR